VVQEKRIDWLKKNCECGLLHVYTLTPEQQLITVSLAFIAAMPAGTIQCRWHKMAVILTVIH